MKEEEKVVELEIVGSASDYELAELLGEKPAHFLVLYLDGVAVQDVGTPMDSPIQRAAWDAIMSELNDRSAPEHWERFFENWKRVLCRLFNLPSDTTPTGFHPVASFKVRRVVRGYTEHLHAAIGLLERLDPKVENWSVGKLSDGQFFAKITARNLASIMEGGESLPLCICRATIWFLKREGGAA